MNVFVHVVVQKNVLSATQMDATGFYNQTDDKRGARRLRANVRRAMRRHAGDTSIAPPRGVAVFKEHPVRGYIGGSPHECKPDRTFIDFQTIRDVWNFVTEDVFLCLGNLRIERVGGWMALTLPQLDGTGRFSRANLDFLHACSHLTFDD